MNWWLVLLPLSGAAVGFISAKILSGYFFSKILPAEMPGLKLRVGAAIGGQLKGAGIAADTSRLLPLIESHIDDFLRNRLKVAIPMIGMMIGERTISQLKEVFMKELESILPGVLQDYVRGFDFSALIDKLPVEQLLRPVMSRYLTPVCVVVGFLVGVVNWGIVGLVG